MLLASARRSSAVAVRSGQQQTVFCCLHSNTIGKVTYIYMYLKDMLIDSERTVTAT